jgi:hypothetical protein
MGLIHSYLEPIGECIAATLGDLRGKRMLELGNQRFQDDSIPERTGKEYFTKRGVKEHISIDLNGLDGAIRLDLSRVITVREWCSYFDVVTNFGTSQYLEPKAAQYVCFRNIHNWLKVGGVAIHIVPDADELKQKGLLKGFCNNYYSHAFFENLAAHNRYELVCSKLTGCGHRLACVQKTQDAPFMGDRKEFLKHITRRMGGFLYVGMNDRGLVMRCRGLMVRLSAKTRPLRHWIGLHR